LHQAETRSCRVGISFGEKSRLYSFPGNHPLNNRRIELFGPFLLEQAKSSDKLSIVDAHIADQQDLLLFHTKQYVEFVQRSSIEGGGFLDYGDTPSYKGVYEAALYTVGNSLNGLRMISNGKVDHFFNPIGGLHHARKDRAGGFCVFNDCAIAISKVLNDFDLKRIAYVDIDAHHGDGIYYGFEEDPRVFIGDIHEDGRFLYPGSGSSDETGKGKAIGTKLNVPIDPGSGDEAFIRAFDNVLKFIESSNPEYIFLQCGADGLEGDPITHLRYSAMAHTYATKKLHQLAHKVCNGRIVAMGGGGYNPRNVRDAWMAVVKELCSF